MDDITASIIVACQTDGASAAVSKLGFSFAMLAREAFNFGQKAVSEFRVTQDAAWKFGKTFKDNMGTAENAVRSFMDEYNLAESTARSMLTDTAQVMKGMGFDEKQALEISKTISEWGIDLASFSGYAGGAQGAVQAITASMMGENERLKGLGVVIREDSDEFRNMTKEIMKTKNVSEQHAKALAKLQLITIKAKDAHKDYIAPGENFTQSVNNLNQQIKQAVSNIGEVIYETLRLNDVFGWVGEWLKGISQSWAKEKETWIYLIREFVNNFVALVQIVSLPFQFLWAHIKQGFENVVTIGQWFYDNWSKIWSNSFEIVKAVFLDIWEYIKWFWGPDGMITGFFVTAGKSIWEAIKTGLKGGDVGKVFKDAFEGYLDQNVIGGFAKQGKNIEAAMKKAGVSDLKLGFADFNFAEEYGNIMDELNRKQIAEQKRFEERTNAKQNKRGKDQNKETAAAFGPAILGDLAKELSKFKATAQSAIDAKSLEGLKLQSRRLTQAPEDWTKKTADGVAKIVDILKAFLPKGQVKSGLENVSAMAGPFFDKVRDAWQQAGQTMKGKEGGTSPAPTINVPAPAVKIPAPAVIAQPAPAVNVRVPDAKAPAVSVNVPADGKTDFSWGQRTADGVATIVGQLREIGKSVALKAAAVAVTTPAAENAPADSWGQQAVGHLGTISNIVREIWKGSASDKDIERFERSERIRAEFQDVLNESTRQPPAFSADVNVPAQKITFPPVRNTINVASPVPATAGISPAAYAGGGGDTQGLSSILVHLAKIVSQTDALKTKVDEIEKKVGVMTASGVKVNLATRKY